MSSASSIPTLYKLPHDTKVQFLHLLRRLLRETSYLPDSAARTYYRSYILSRYRIYSPRKAQPCKDGQFSFPAYAKPVQSAERASSLLHQCQQALNGLRRANAGYYRPLLRVLETTYGRIGKRRHELLAPHLAPDTPDDDKILRENLPPALEGDGRPAKDPRDENVPTISSAVRALANSQRKNSSSTRDRTFISRVDPVIPPLNNKARPMPIKRVRNIKKRAYGALIEKILPPLPKDEWERLRDLVMHRTEWEGLSPRRKKATPWDELEGYDELAISEVVVRKYGGLWGGRHELSPRFMRRLWGRVFEQCPLLWKDSTRNVWKVEWGHAQGESSPVPEASAAEAYMFAPMDGGRWNTGDLSMGEKDRPSSQGAAMSSGEAQAA